jgi:hypothetical protein
MFMICHAEKSKRSFSVTQKLHEAIEGSVKSAWAQLVEGVRSATYE